MFTQCVVRLGEQKDYRQRRELLKVLHSEVVRGAYAPRPIHGYLSSPKGQGVVRFIPVFSFHDYAVFFGCVRSFDEQVAQLAVEDTYGGWSLGGKRREFEEQHAKASIASARSSPPVDTDPDFLGYDFGISTPVSSYNRWAWLANWSQYWKLLAAKFEHAPEDAMFAMFDVANFYDTVDLPRLIRDVRSQVKGASLPIELLSFFLSNWNRALHQYAPTTKGLPMDIVGDCSRVLANFYLTPFDTAMRRESLARQSHFMRFADDMVVACPDKKTCEELLFFASTELHRIGLNINVAKVRFLSKEEFHHWWGFGIMDCFEVDDQLLDGLLQLRGAWGSAGYGRKSMALKRALSKLAKLPNLKRWRQWMYNLYCSSDDLLLELNERQMSNLLSIAPSMPEALECLETACFKTPYTAPYASLLRCLEPLRKNKDKQVRSTTLTIVERIAGINDPVLNLAIRTIPQQVTKAAHPPCLLSHRS